MKTKVLFINNAFYESTFPLIKYLKRNIDVSILCVQNNKLLSPPEFDCSFLINENYGLYNAKYFTGELPKNLINYFENEVGFINILYTKSIFYSIAKILSFIDSHKPDIIHFVGITIPFSLISRLVKQKVVFSIHEYTLNRTLDNNSFKSNLKKLIFDLIEFNVYSNKKNTFIFHSKNQLEAFKSKFDSRSAVLIYFGLFETFKYYDTTHNMMPFDNYLLFVGTPKYYKGLDILIHFLNENNSNLNVIVAGSGVSKFDSMKRKNNFHFIDKFLNGIELRRLISNSMGVILPYRSASQSGLPSLCIGLSTPVISTSVPGILEYLEPDWNSIVIDFSDSSKNKILLDEKSLKKKLQELKINISKRPYNTDSFEWIQISKKTLEFYMQ